MSGVNRRLQFRNSKFIAGSYWRQGCGWPGIHPAVSAKPISTGQANPTTLDLAEHSFPMRREVDTRPRPPIADQGALTRVAVGLATG